MRFELGQKFVVIPFTVPRCPLHRVAVTAGPSRCPPQGEISRLTSFTTQDFDKDMAVKSQVVAGRAASKHEQVFTQMKLSDLKLSVDTCVQCLDPVSVLCFVLQSVGAKLGRP